MDTIQKIKPSWIIFAVLVLLLSCSPLLILSIWANNQFTDLRPVHQLKLTDANTNFRFSKNGCTGHWAEKDTFRTNASRQYVWDEVYAIWQTRPGTASLRHVEAFYTDNSLQPIQLKSKISYDSYPHLYSVLVTNEVIIQFPNRICNAGISVANLRKR